MVHLIKRMISSKSKKNATPIREQNAPELNKDSLQRELGASLSDNIRFLQETLGQSSDYVCRKIGEEDNLAVAYLQGMADQKLLAVLMKEMLPFARASEMATHLPHRIAEQLPFGNVEQEGTEQEVLKCILNGKVVLLVDGMNGALSVAIQGGAQRAVEEPTSQTVIRGPKEGFTENIGTNIALVRRKVKSLDMRVKTQTIGRLTQTEVSTVYLEGIAKPEVLEEVTARLGAIDIDSVLESGYLEEFLQNRRYTPFPTMMNTERPDAVAASILEGGVAIFVDGTPFVLLAPATFFKFLFSSEDYYQSFDISTFLRFVRFFSFLVATFLPSLFIAITTFHQEMLPTTLLISLTAQREGTPLPALIEALLMELTFEIIREAGVRMPRAIGPAISIVGALVLGQAAVQAGLVSAAMVIVVSFTAISNFVIPAINLAAAIRLLRFVFMILGGTLGLFGILAGAIPVLVHMIALRSFGVPYMTPLAPFDSSAFRDFLIRAPWSRMNRRPVTTATHNLKRQPGKESSGLKEEERS
ncbi:spore germination protein [Gorillibacterium timonense]|uniref:spore germination protein n=1 Tax=Gorillibacterium timonense TaxID=1689269 RepID=UPI0009E7316C|nr:spore germination protein [Gorillibacterium timonense]